VDRLRIAIVAPSLDILGGQSVQADLLVRAWEPDPEVDAWLVPINPPLPPPVRWTKRVKYLRTVATECTYVPRLIREIGRADVVHVFSASYWSFLLAPVPAIAAAKLHRRPVVLNYHSGEAPDHLAKSPTARAILAGVDRIVVPSAFLVRVFQRFDLGATAISNIVDLSRFTYRERCSTAPRILSTRSFEGLYNVACTIRAFRLVQDRYPDASLTLAGGGRHEGALRRLVSDLAVRNVTFAGRVPPDRVPGLYADHDVYLQSPNIDNMPLSVLEAFASGVPVVSTDVGGIPDIVTHRVTGLLAPAGDHAALAAHVLELVADPPLALSLARTAAKSRDRYHWHSVRRHWLGLYRAMVTPPGTGIALASVPESATHGKGHPS
jgi:glycosyltransferase involved in cell wall biosynthesis